MQEKPDKLRPALFGGLTIVILSNVPFLNFVNCFCCAGVMAGGFLSVYFYNKNLIEAEGISLTYNDAVHLGLMSAAFGAVIGTIVATIIGTNLQQQIDKMLEYSGEFPPEIQDALLRLSEDQSGFFLITLGLLISLLIYSIFAVIGAIIGVSILTKKTISS